MKFLVESLLSGAMVPFLAGQIAALDGKTSPRVRRGFAVVGAVLVCAMASTWAIRDGEWATLAAFPGAGLGLWATWKERP